MQWFNNLKLRKKLILAFSLISVILIIEGIVGLNKINVLGKISTEMYNKNLLTKEKFSNVIESLYEYRLMIYKIISEDDSKEMERIQEVLIQKNEKIKTLLSDNSLSKFSSELEEFQNVWNLTIENSQQIIKFAQQYAKEDATTKTNGENKELFDRSISILQDISHAIDTKAEENFNKGQSVIQNAFMTMLLVIIIGIIISIFLAFIIAKLITVPLVDAVSIAGKLSKGDLSVDIEITSNDEVGELLSAMQKMVKNLNKVIGQVSISANEIASGSEQLSSASQNISNGSIQQAVSLEEISSSAEELDIQTKSNASNADEANKITIKSREGAEKGNRKMQEMLLSMNEINQASENISAIIKAIDEIAFQTNVLAINAAVEAARAGTHGKGFAVVAKEVRNLAQRSANAAKETERMIRNSVKKIETGVLTASETAEALKEIVSGCSEAERLVREIALASNEQSKGVSVIVDGMNQLSNVTQETASATEESSASTQELSNQAQALNEVVSHFILRDDDSEIEDEDYDSEDEEEFENDFEEDDE